jgi:hypothetical protein
MRTRLSAEVEGRSTAVLLVRAFIGGCLLALGLPDRWFLTFYPSPDIRINFGDPITGQTGWLFLPFDARIGRQLSNNFALSFELGAPIIRDYPVYNLKMQVRLNVTY